MKKTQYSQDVNIPSIEDFVADYPRYGSFATGEGRPLFDLIMRPEIVVRSQHASFFGYPSVQAVAEECTRKWAENGSGPLPPFAKQFIGAAICALMRANGYSKTGIKKSIPHQSFSTGEYYTKG